jgi:anti-sigma regulatory factor (Ser/Thr protein kinase)
MEVKTLGTAAENSVVAVEDQTHVAEARRTALRLAASLGFDQTASGNVGLVVTEAAKNVIKHAGGGEILLRAWRQCQDSLVEMLAIDRGPGIANLSRSFEDGYSTTGTPGNGLGAISRLATFHDIYSQPGIGTVLLAQIRFQTSAAGGLRASPRFDVGAVSVPKPGESVCGDAWGFQTAPGGRARLIVADGLGHGILAAEASREAVRVHAENAQESGADLMRHIHDALRSTRGAAVALAEIDPGEHTLLYTGIGNIAGKVTSPGGPGYHVVSQPGTAGHELHRIVEFRYSWEPGSTLILSSDGLSTHWSLDRYPGLAHRHPALIAGVLYRDCSRSRDDTTVVAVRNGKGTP